MSRRTLLRTSIGAAVGLWLLEVGAGTIGFLWPSIASGIGSQVKIGTFKEIKVGELDACRSTRASRPTTRRRGRTSC